MRKVLYILGQLDDRDVSWLSATGLRRDCVEGETLITQGVASADVFIALQGLLSVSINGKPVAELGPGELVGEMSLVDKRPPSATVRAARPSNVLAIDRKALEQKLANDDGFAARFYRAIAMFLAARMRASSIQAGDEAMDAEVLSQDEVDLDVLDNIHLAGIRFEGLLRTLGQGR